MASNQGYLHFYLATLTGTYNYSSSNWVVLTVSGDNNKSLLWTQFWTGRDEPDAQYEIIPTNLHLRLTPDNMTMNTFRCAGSEYTVTINLQDKYLTHSSVGEHRWMKHQQETTTQPPAPQPTAPPAPPATHQNSVNLPIAELATATSFSSDLPIAEAVAVPMMTSSSDAPTKPRPMTMPSSSSRTKLKNYLLDQELQDWTTTLLNNGVTSLELFSNLEDQDLQEFGGIPRFVRKTILTHVHIVKNNWPGTAPFPRKNNTQRPTPPLEGGRLH